MEPIKKRHPRLAVWLTRGGEFAAPAACAVLAGTAALVGRWDEAGVYFAGLVICCLYQWRLQQAWVWGWRAGSRDVLDWVLPSVDIEAPGAAERLREAYMAEVPTWRQHQDRLAQIDHKATLRASMEQLERVYGPFDSST